MPGCLRLHHTKVITALALDPREERLAAGDATGRILIWHGFASAAAAAAARAPSAPGGGDAGGAGSAAAGGSGGAGAVRVPLATMHWHAQAVGFVAFSPDGAYLLSGGAEAVLVLWRLDAGGTRTFLPRVGGALRGLAQSPADPSLVALACADNTHRVVNTAAMRVEATVAGARPARLRVGSGSSGGDACVPAPPAWDARMRAAVLAGAGGVLQWYDVARDRAVGTLAVVESGASAPPPPPPADAGGAAPLEPHVSHFALGASGRSLVTLDVRGEGGAEDAAETLRFWELPAEGSEGPDLELAAAVGKSGGAAAASGPPFRLNTRVEAPHRGRVAALAHHPRGRVAATASAAGADFRVWARGSGAAGPASAWRCRSVGFFQGRPMHALAFSHDGACVRIRALLCRYACGGVRISRLFLRCALRGRDSPGASL
jgi:NET1-associated nuclear protein 1 (U3 small nucleolar RNA-associated protein 17)